ncbi:FGGY-family carbohydrate kinase [Litoribrevibacter euphylliae]|uniref:FGGY-family carbohydrate kinase n=1 Tax=Litoribrevibacter euphylliae TaxID=1834034 RepID=A0ABV7HGJ6_9GAMM
MDKITKVVGSAKSQPSSTHILAIDNGTQSIRALVFDLEGQLIAKSKVHLEAYFSKHPGWAEQYPEYYWKSLSEACNALWQDPQVDRNNIRAMAVTTQRGTVINLDKDGHPLRPAIIWLDQRKADTSEPVGGLWGAAFKILGLTETINTFRAKTQARWIQQQQPEIWAKTDKYLLLSGYLNYKLTGEFKDSIGSQVGYIPFDYKRLKWAPHWDWKWKATGIRPEQLPELVNPGDGIGKVTREASEYTGIPEGLPVIAAASDKACEIIGSGGVSPNIACLSFGTTATINTINDKYVETIPMIPPYAAAIPNAYSTEVMIYRGFWMVSWFKKQFGLREIKVAQERGIEPEQLFDELVNSVPPGSMGLMLQPYWTPGLKNPGPEAKGAIIGFGDVHTRAHIYRAILEGLVYGLREGRERIEKRSGTHVSQVRVAGGGSQSNAAMQITADIFGIPVERPHTYETSGLGAAIDVAVGMGYYRSFDQAIANMTHTGDVFYPNKPTQDMYDRLYKEVYLKMYKQLQPLYKSIRDITGYPE